MNEVGNDGEGLNQILLEWKLMPGDKGSLLGSREISETTGREGSSNKSGGRLGGTCSSGREAFVSIL